MPIHQLLITFLAFTVLVCPATGLAQIYKCTVNGKIIFTDQACDEGEQVQLREINTLSTVQSADFFHDDTFYSSKQWHDGINAYYSAKALAEKYQAPMLLYFRTDWCSFCYAVDHHLLPKADAIDAMKPFVKVRINPEHGAAEERLFKSMGGKGYPTVWVVPYGKNKKRIGVTPKKSEKRAEKNLSADEFIANLAPYQPPPPLPSAEDHHQRARQMLAKGERLQAIKDVKTAIGRDPMNFKHYKLMDDILAQERKFTDIIRYWDNFLRLSPEHAQGFLERSGAHYHQGNINAAMADAKSAALLGNQQAATLYQQLQKQEKTVD